MDRKWVCEKNLSQDRAFEKTLQGPYVSKSKDTGSSQILIFEQTCGPWTALFFENVSPGQYVLHVQKICPSVVCSSRPPAQEPVFQR